MLLFACKSAGNDALLDAFLSAGAVACIGARDDLDMIQGGYFLSYFWYLNYLHKQDGYYTDKDLINDFRTALAFSNNMMWVMGAVCLLLTLAFGLLTILTWSVFTPLALFFAALASHFIVS